MKIIVLAIFVLFTKNVAFSQGTTDGQFVVETNQETEGIGTIKNLSEKGFAGLYYQSGSVLQGWIGYVGNGAWVDTSTFQIGSSSKPIHFWLKGSAMSIDSSEVIINRKVLMNENVSFGGTPNDIHRLTVKVRSGNDLIRYLDANDNQVWHTRMVNKSLSWTESGKGDNRFVLAPGGKIGLNTAMVSEDAALEHSSGAKLTLSGIWTDASDRIKKENIGHLEYGLNEVLSLKPVRYDYKSNDEASFGFIAQDLEKVLPELVFGKDGNMSIAYGQITAVLTAAIQEQQSIIEKQEQKLKAQQAVSNKLKNKVASLDARIQRLESMIADLDTGQ